MKTAIVLTTINVPTLLEAYADNFARHRHLDDVQVFVIGDRKTPAAAAQLVAGLADRGLSARYVDIPDQEAWLRRVPELAPFIPYDSDNRRNIGYLMAAEEGAELLIALDDDNLVGQGDYLAAHRIVGGVHRLPTVASPSGWYNICELLETDPPRTIYPRGYPYTHRWADGALQWSETEGRVLVNEGLWVGAPDVDAVTRLNEPVRTVALRRPRVMLARGTFAPINTQNTAIDRDVLPAFYFVLQAGRSGPVIMDRFGDIFCGLFVNKVVEALDGRIVFGVPVATHERNAHNFFRDLEQELLAIRMTDILADILSHVSLRAANSADAYLELVEAVEAGVNRRPDIEDALKAHFRLVARAQRAWVAACRTVDAGLRNPVATGLAR